LNSRYCLNDFRSKRLYQELSLYSLEQLDFKVAERCFAVLEAYWGLNLISKLQQIPDSMKQRAIIYSVFNKVEDAESIYREIDRKDLAIDLRYAI